MRQDKAFPFRVTFTGVIFTLDIWLLPQLLTVLNSLKQQHSIAAFHLSVFGGFRDLPLVWDTWCWLQPLVIGVIVFIWLTGRSLVNVHYDSDLPQTAGHGQHGTSKWLQENEVDHYFSVHKISGFEKKGGR